MLETSDRFLFVVINFVQFNTTTSVIFIISFYKIPVNPEIKTCSCHIKLDTTCQCRNQYYVSAGLRHPFVCTAGRPLAVNSGSNQGASLA